ncbi:hypothetical protein EX30DRAFT_339641 [Ascodesmis nigricans]|uniref:HTH APSES-type domain-containing protein n=1 Tax=Ascodesmis nigricans TaxID=341454 RepID=A0A4V3SJ23_9PEZI|nr:hypothetical protein EX30DRAFT_339641 [Ascodesmis nigricans]
MSVPRSLPKRVNPNLKTPPPHHELVDNRRLGQTNLGEKGTMGGPFSYVHLRVALPHPLEEQELFGSGAPESYFLMRRSKDGFVSSTGMFKATFPWARKSEEEAEKIFVKFNYPKTSRDETAGNLWVDPTDALEIARDYGILPWIEALLDNEPVMPSDHRKRCDITPPPPYFRPGELDKAAALAPPLTPGTRRRSTRSMSPGKRVSPRKSRASKAAPVRESPLKKEVTPISETQEEEVASITTTAETILTSVVPTVNGHSLTTPVKKDQPVSVEVGEEVETNGDVAVKTTHVKVQLPPGVSGEPPSAESTEAMLARAREMVEEAKKIDSQSPAASKRKAEDDEEVDAEEEERKAKKAKVLEEQLRKERVKNRALIGLTATLALGALLPYVL